MSLFRKMPHWQVLLFYYGFGIAVAVQFLEDLLMGQGAVHTGEFAPWRQYVDFGSFLGDNHYTYFAITEAVLLICYFFRIQVRVTALLLGMLMFADNLGSFLNHRLLMSLEMMLISFVPVPKIRDRLQLHECKSYWNMDVIRFQVSLVYVVTALHKCNWQFLSGRTLNNLFFMVHDQGMMRFPDWLFPIIQDPRVCFVMGLITVVVEFVLAFGLHSRRYGNWFLALALATHFGFAILMPYIWIFTTQMYFTLYLFYRPREIETSQGAIGER